MEYNLKSALEVPDEDLKQCPYCKETVSSYARHLKDCHARILKIYQYQGQQKDDGQKLDQILNKVNGGQKVSSNSAHEEQNILPKNLQEVAEVVHEGIEQLPNPVHEGQKETEIEKNDGVVSINLDAEVTSNSNEMYAIVKERGQSTRCNSKMKKVNPMWGRKMVDPKKGMKIVNPRWGIEKWVRFNGKS